MRKPGFYWVKYAQDKWYPAEWNAREPEKCSYWCILSNEDTFTDSDFLEIDETPIERR